MAMEATLQVEAQIKARGYYGDFENRFSSYGAIKAYFDNAAELLPGGQIERIRNASNVQAITFPVLQKNALSVITARSCTVTGTEPTAVKPTFSKITRGFEFKLYDRVFDSNEFSIQEAYARQMANGLREVMANLDTYSANLLESTKSTSVAAVKLPGLTVASNVYQVDAAHRDRFYYYLPTILAKNDLNTGRNNNIANTEARELMLEYEALGTYNNENRAAVLRGDLPSAAGFRHYTSNRIVAGAGVQEVHYLVPFGAIGVFTWNDTDAINRREGPGGMRLYTIQDQVFGIRWDVRAVPICDDISATYGAGFEAAVGTKYQFAADFGFLNAFSSDSTRANIKVQLMEV